MFGKGGVAVGRVRRDRGSGGQETMRGGLLGRRRGARWCVYAMEGRQASVRSFRGIVRGVIGERRVTRIFLHIRRGLVVGGVATVRTIGCVRLKPLRQEGRGSRRAPPEEEQE